MRREIPPEWRVIMERRGINSLRRLSDAAEVSNSVASRVVHGDAIPTDETVQALAKALSVPAARIYELVQVSAPDQAEPWTPPAESARLTGAQRDALNILIRTMVDVNKGRMREDQQTARFPKVGGESLLDEAAQAGLTQERSKMRRGSHANT